MKIPGSSVQSPSPGASVSSAVRMAMLVKAKDAQKAEGEAALKLIESGENRGGRGDDTRGSRFDRYA